MSRTIRNKGRYLFEIEQMNNPLRYIKYSWYRTSELSQARIDYYIEKHINDNLKFNEKIEQLKKECHRDGFHVTCRWKRYIEKNPRVYHKMAIAKSLKMDSDYQYDEHADRRARRAMASNWD